MDRQALLRDKGIVRGEPVPLFPGDSEVLGYVFGLTVNVLI